MVYHNTGTKENPIPCFPFPGLNSYGRQDRRIDTGTESPHHTAGALRKRSRGFAWRVSPADTAIKHGHIISKQVDWPKKYVVIFIIHYLPTEGYFNATLPGKNLENSEWFSPTGHLSRPSMFGQMDRWREKSRTTRGPVYQPFFRLNTFCKHHLDPKAIVCFNFLGISFPLTSLSLGTSFSSHPFLLTPLSRGNCCLDASLSLTYLSLDILFWCLHFLLIRFSLDNLDIPCIDSSESWHLILLTSLLRSLSLDVFSLERSECLSSHSPGIFFSWHLFLLTCPCCAGGWPPSRPTDVVDDLVKAPSSFEADFCLSVFTSLLSSLRYFLHVSTFFTSLHNHFLYVSTFFQSAMVNFFCNFLQFHFNSPPFFYPT